MFTPSQLIEQAQSYIGYLEKASNSNLDSFADNAGRSNYTRFARDVDAAKLLNGPKQGYEWCAVAVIAWGIYAWGAEEAKRRLCVGPYSAGCGWVVKYYKSAGRWFSTPKPGDQVVFQVWNKVKQTWEACHTGLVYDVTDSRIYTIEGNTSAGSDVVIPNGGAVAKKSYARNSTYIMGYGRPLYDEVDEGPVSSGSGCPYAEPEAKTVVRLGTRGNDAGWVQWHLNRAGYDLGVYGIDEDIGPITEAAIKAFQAANGLEADGEAGPITRPVLAAAQEPGTFYTVVRGDTLSAIAKKYNTTTKALANLNGLDNPSLIFPGQKLRIGG